MAATLAQRWFPNSDQFGDRRGYQLRSRAARAPARRTAGARSWRTACASSCATARWTPASACRLRGRWPATWASRGAWSSTPTRSCSRRAIWSRARAPAPTSPSRRAVADGAAPAQTASAPQFDFFPGAPDLSAFPRTLWLRAMREVLRTAPDGAFAYPDARGAPELRARAQRLPAPRARRRRRRRLDRRLRRRDAGAGAARRARSAQGVTAIDVEDPGLPPHRAVLVLRRAGASRRARRRAGRRRGARCARRRVLDARRRTSARPASCSRRSGAAGSSRWARAGGLVIEDDYDAEFRYDRAPLGALQGLAPDRVVYMGTVSQDARARRCGWAGSCCRRRCSTRSRRQGARRPRLPDARPARARAAVRDAPPTTATCAARAGATARAATR